MPSGAQVRVRPVAFHPVQNLANLLIDPADVDAKTFLFVACLAWLSRDQSFDKSGFCSLGLSLPAWGLLTSNMTLPRDIEQLHPLNI